MRKTLVPPTEGSNAGDFLDLRGVTGATYVPLIQNQDPIYCGGVDYVCVDNTLIEVYWCSIRRPSPSMKSADP